MDHGSFNTAFLQGWGILGDAIFGENMKKGEGKIIFFYNNE
jgi:hypothetical protein